MARVDSDAPRSFTAGTDLERYDAVMMGAADETVVRVANANQLIVGFVDEDTKSGENVGVYTTGVVMAKANGRVTRGQSIVGAANGRVAGVAASLANNIRAVAVEEAAAAGQVFKIVLS